MELTRISHTVSDSSHTPHDDLAVQMDEAVLLEHCPHPSKQQSQSAERRSVQKKCEKSGLITSLQNPKVKQALKLWKRGERETTDCFLIEGYRELNRAAEAHLQIKTLFVCRSLFLGSNEESLIQKLTTKNVSLVDCSEVVFKKLSYRDRPDGLLAVAHQFHTPLSALKSCSNPFYVVAEGIEKPGNLGTILRASDATGVDGVIVCDRQTDIHNPNVVRASVGTLFTLPVVEATGEEAYAWLKSQGILIVSATPSASHLFTQIDLTRPIALVVGTEQYGLSRRWLEGADIRVRIPMLGMADSLNVAMATTLLLYEALRQRGDKL
jgi:RNA methyltransferase, TrmH family